MSERASNPEMTISLNPNVRESPLKIEPTEAKAAGEEGTENAATAEQKNASETNKIADTPKPTHCAQDDGKREIEAAALREWDFSNRKVILQNIFKYDDTRTLKKTSLKWIKQMKVLSNVDVEFDRIKKAPKESWTVLTLASESMVQPFIDFINNTDVTNKKGAKIYAKRADAEGQVREGARCKREVGSDNVEDQSSSKRQRVEDKTKEARRPVSDDEIRDKVVPLWRLPYDKQVDTKMKEMIKKCAMKIVAETKSRFRDLSRNENRNNVQVYKWLTKQRCIELSDMITAPSKIRNKNEFTFGYRYLFGTNGGCSDEISEADFTKVPSVGFMVTGWAGGVSRPHCCENIPREACMVVDIVDDFLQTSPLPPYDSKFHKGFWRTLTIRTSRRTKECMVIIVHSPASGGVGDADGYAEHFEKEKERLVALLKGAELQTEVAELQPLKVTSIFYQEFEGLSNPKPDHPVQHVYGKQFLHERLGKCIFQISPGAFFQVNTEGAEILYQLVVDQIREVSQNPKDTTLLDVCCGTGTIGLTCVTEGVVAEVVGVDISEPAINDARKNAELNGCGQYDKDTGGLIHFVAGRAEQIMTSVISDAKQSGKKLVAVVDPARDGLHADVVRALRANERIKRIVYVSCNPTGTLVRDAALFCAPPTKRYNGSAFRVVAASPVDMFPGTAHTEVVMTFDRLSDKDAYGQ